MTSFEKIQRLLKSDSSQNSLTWVFTGDSVTHGAVHLNDHRDYVQLFEQRLRCQFELARTRDTVIKTSIQGWTTKDILQDIQTRILCHKPQVLSIMLGINDSNALSVEEFERNYNAIIDNAIEVSGPAFILHTTNPVQKDGTSVDYLTEYNDVIRNIANQRKAVLVDHSAAWAKSIEENPRRIDFWMSDSLHPNSYGHIAMAEALWGQLDIFDSKSPICRLFKP